MFTCNKEVIKKICLASVLSAAMVTTVSAKDFGIGVIVGEPTGISGKKFLDNNRAVDFALAWSFDGNDSLQAHANYLFHQGAVPITANTQGPLSWYWGIGARLKLKEDEGNNNRNNNDDLLGVRAPVGVAWYPDNTPLEVFGELAPTLDVIPDTDFDLGAGLGVRYYF